MSASIIAVMAGTLVDTQMGLDFLKARDPSLTLLAYPISQNPREQNAFQLGAMEEKVMTVQALVRDAKAKGAGALLVYCNSLSGALDFDSLCAREGIKLVTPLMVHRSLARASRRVGLIAANNQSLHGIERVMFEANPLCDVLGVSLLPLVEAIEARRPPASIAEEFGLDSLLDFFDRCQADCVCLGCTHFPYMAGELRRRTRLEIFNPDDSMYELLI